MNTYIQTENGEPINHPAFEDNLIQAFGAIPENWEPFNRVERPLLTGYKILDSDTPVYAKVDGVWTDVWTIRDMTEEEKTAKQQYVISAFNSRPQFENWAAWTLDVDTLKMVPPIPRPEPDQAKLDAGIKTFWCGADANWKDTPIQPDGDYKFDFFAWQWIQIVD